MICFNIFGFVVVIKMGVRRVILILVVFFFVYFLFVIIFRMVGFVFLGKRFLVKNFNFFVGSIVFYSFLRDCFLKVFFNLL